MGTPTDAVLALVALAAFVVAGVAVDASLSYPSLLVGAAGTIAFELLATRDPATVREYWERRPVQAASLVLALVVAGVGALVAPRIVLSAGIGALVTYVCFLGLVGLGVVEPLDD